MVYWGKHARCCDGEQQRWDIPWEGATLQDGADLESDERLYFLSEIHVTVVGIDENGSGRADEEHLLVGRFIRMH